MPRPTKRPPAQRGPGRSGLTAAAARLEMQLYAIALMRSAPVTTRDLALTMGRSRDTVERLLAVIRGLGLGLTSEKRGREVYHSLPASTPGKVLR